MLKLWNDNLLIGVEEVDKQHKELVHMIENFFESCTNRFPQERLLTMLEFLETYVVEHFRDEEALQEKIGFPGLEEHRKIHESFNLTLCNLKVKLQTGSQISLLIDEMNTNLSRWLIKHIMEEDQKIGEYMRENNINLSQEAS